MNERIWRNKLTIKIRTTETTPNPMIQKLFSEFAIADIQGFIFQSNDEQLLNASEKNINSIKIHCLEAIEIDNAIELDPEKIFKKEEWIHKINAANFFDTDLLLLSHLKDDTCLFRLYKVTEEESTIVFTEINLFNNEKDFMVWWNSIKLLSQTKITYEARERQDRTNFDAVIERNGSAWGGNIDGFILSDSMEQVRAIIEIRQTHRFPLINYDPARFFLGTRTKSGDFKTWLPLIYLKNAYNIPLILVTVSTSETSKFGYAEVEKIDNSALYYKNNLSPNQNLTGDIHELKQFIVNIENSI